MIAIVFTTFFASMITANAVDVCVYLGVGESDVYDSGEWCHWYTPWSTKLYKDYYDVYLCYNSDYDVYYSVAYYLYSEFVGCD